MDALRTAVERTAVLSDVPAGATAAIGTVRAQLTTVHWRKKAPACLIECTSAACRHGFERNVVRSTH